MATCEERVVEHMERTLEDLHTLWDLYCEDSEASDEDLGNMYEYGLSFDYVAPDTFRDQERGYFRYQLSCGGPSDEFRFYAEQLRYGWRPYCIEYWFLDWYDGAHRELRGKDKEFMKEIFDWFDGAGSTQSVFDKAMEDWEPQHEEEDEDYEWLFDDDTDDEEKDVTIRTIEDIKETLRNIGEGG